MNTNVSRRAVLVSGAKYAAMAPATTLIVSKSARAGGSVLPPFVGPGGVLVPDFASCPDLISAPGQVTQCQAYFLGL